MDYNFKKRFKHYEDEDFVVDKDLVEIYYSSGWTDEDKVMVKPLIIERVTPKKIFYSANHQEATVSGGQALKETVGLIKGNYMLIAKEDTDTAIEFMINSYREEYEKQIAKLQEKLNDINNAVVKRLGEI